MHPIVILAMVLFAGLIAWIVHRGSVEVERTIRVAIERGLVTDPEQIVTLRQTARLGWTGRLQLLGLGLVVLAAAVMAVALVIVLIVRGMPTPLFLLATFLGVAGAGQYACGGWLRTKLGDT